MAKTLFQLATDATTAAAIDKPFRIGDIRAYLQLVPLDVVEREIRTITDATLLKQIVAAGPRGRAYEAAMRQLYIARRT